MEQWILDRHHFHNVFGDGKLFGLDNLNTKCLDGLYPKVLKALLLPHCPCTPRTCISPNAQPIHTASGVRDLGLLLNTGFSATDNVVRATKKARGMVFHLKRSFAALAPSMFLPLCKAFIHSILP